MIRITCNSGMVNIGSDRLAYSNIQGMYKNSNGVGIQVDKGINTDKVSKLCNDISDKLYALEELLNE